MHRPASPWGHIRQQRKAGYRVHKGLSPASGSPNTGLAVRGALALGHVIDSARNLAQPGAHVLHDPATDEQDRERGQSEVNEGEHGAMNVASSVRLYGVRRKLARLRASLPPYRLPAPCTPCGSRQPGPSITTRVGDGPDGPTALFCCVADAWMAATCLGAL